MNKRALIIAFHFPPQSVSSGIQRTLSFSKHLGAHGWEPLVLSACAMAYSATNPSQLAQLPPDLVVKRAFALDAKRHMGILGRYPEVIALPDRWISWWFSAVPSGLALIRRYKPSVIWSTFPLATSHLIGLTLHRLTGLPWIADFRDPMLQDDFPTTVLQRKAYAWIERQAIARCHKAVFTTESAMRAYMQRFPQALHEKFTVIENGYDEDGFSGTTAGQDPADAPAGKKITLLHSGVLYSEGRDPSAFFEALSLLKKRNATVVRSLRVVLRATGDDAYFQSLVRKHDVEDIVEIAPLVSYHTALREMLAVDGLLVFQGTPFNTQVPAKIYEYFRARKPILGLVDTRGETARILNAAGFSAMAPIDNAAEILPALESFVSDVQHGTAYVASDSVIDAASRKQRTRELARIFEYAAAAP